MTVVCKCVQNQRKEHLSVKQGISLLKVEQVIENTSKMKFQCLLCEKCYGSKMTLSNHKRLVHGNPRVYLCTKCEYTTKIKRDQDMHIRSVHEKIQEECMECGKKYSNIYNLKRHKRKHHMNIQQNCMKFGEEVITNNHM